MGNGYGPRLRTKARSEVVLKTYRSSRLRLCQQNCRQRRFVLDGEMNARRQAARTGMWFAAVTVTLHSPAGGFSETESKE